MKRAIVVDNQTIYDIAVQYCGDVNAVTGILKDNPSIVNDPRALVAMGIDPQLDTEYYFDMPVMSGLEMLINSEYIKHSIVNQLAGREIATYSNAVFGSDVGSDDDEYVSLQHRHVFRDIDGELDHQRVIGTLDGGLIK